MTPVARRLNAELRGWTTYFRHGASQQTFSYLGHYTWHRVVGWIRRKHRRAAWKKLRHRYLSDRMVPEHDGVALFDPGAVAIVRDRYRGTKIPSPWDQRTTMTTG